MDMKSPARVMEEKSCGESSRSSRSTTPPVSASALHAANQAASTMVSAQADVASPSDSAPVKLTSHLRRRSGTPASIRSKESEDLRERMMTMEAELRALRDELSNRSSLTSNTSSQATLKEIKDQDCSLADSNDNGINNAINEATIDNQNVVKKEENSSSIGSISASEPASKDNNGCGGPSEAKKAKKEDTSEDNADNENKNNNRTTT